jgi:hypothetical protein
VLQRVALLLLLLLVMLWLLLVPLALLSLLVRMIAAAVSSRKACLQLSALLQQRQRLKAVLLQLWRA